MLPDSILPTPEDDIARILRDYERRLSHLETLEGGGGGFEIGARVFNSVEISIASGGFVALTFDSERFDTDNIHNPALNPGRLTARTAGKYYIKAQVTWEGSGAGRRIARLRPNGGVTIADHEIALNTGTETQNVDTVWDMAVDDYVEVVVFQNTGGALNVVDTGRESPEFMMQKIG